MQSLFFLHNESDPGNLLIFTYKRFNIFYPKGLTVCMRPLLVEDCQHLTDTGDAACYLLSIAENDFEDFLSILSS